MAAPRFDPSQRDPAAVAPADTYRRDDSVWVYRNGSWHPGVVNGVSPYAVMVTYQHVGTRGTVVDTVTAEYLVAQADSDPRGGGR
jgi:hypothetical protein